MNRPAASLTTARLTLRQPQAEDLPVYTAYCASNRSQFTGGPFDAVKAFEKFAAMAGHWPLRGFGRYIFTRNGKGIGHVGPMQLDTDVVPEFTWTLWRGTDEGQGFVTEAAKAVHHHLFHECGWQEMIIRIQPDNHRSIAMAERLGATRSDVPAPDWYPDALTYTLTGGTA